MAFDNRDPKGATRRAVLRGGVATGMALGGVLAGVAGAGVTSATAATDPAAEARRAAWASVPKILARIKAPVFPKRVVDITSLGAKGDGVTDASEAIAKAIEQVAAVGGGRVLVPAGRFLTGPIHLKSNVELHVAKGATLLFSRDTDRYLPVVYTRWEGVECYNYSSLIYADQVENVAVTGEGTLDGQADCDNWWFWKGRTNCGWREGLPNQFAARDALFRMGAEDVPVEQRVFGAGHYLRPNMIQICRSKNVLIEGLTLRNSPMFEVNPVLCVNVTVRGIKIISHGPNNDGCDPDSCRDVLIENCSFDTGDDCLAIKAGRNRDGRRVGVPSENIIVRNCVFKEGHGGLTIGSEMSGGVRNVFFENCKLDSPDLNQALRFKTNAMRGGTIEHVYFRNIAIGDVGAAVLQIDFTYEEGPNGPETPVVRDIHLENVTCAKSVYALQLRGFAHSPIKDVHLVNCDFRGIAKPDIVDNVEGLTFDHVKVNGKRVG